MGKLQELFHKPFNTKTLVSVVRTDAELLDGQKDSILLKEARLL